MPWQWTLHRCDGLTASQVAAWTDISNCSVVALTRLASLLCFHLLLSSGRIVQGVLILRPPDAALHALVLLGMNAALALASGSAVASDALADVPWSHDIMLDDSVMQ
jgi:hypothetical protein